MARRYKILIVEDEMIIGAKLSVILEELGYLVTGIIPRAEEVLHHLDTHPPDIILLDIQLSGEKDGIELAIEILADFQIPVIFLTANTDDKTFQRAKVAKPYAFLSKPFMKLDLQRTIELTISRMTEEEEKEMAELNNLSQTSPLAMTDRIFIYDQDKKVKLLHDDILYLRAERNYCRIVTLQKEYILTMPMKSLEDKLPVALFQRIHRSYIVNMKHVDEVDDNSVGINGTSLNLSKSYKREFLKRIRMV